MSIQSRDAPLPGRAAAKPWRGHARALPNLSKETWSVARHMADGWRIYAPWSALAFLIATCGLAGPWMLLTAVSLLQGAREITGIAGPLVTYRVLAHHEVSDSAWLLPAILAGQALLGVAAAAASQCLVLICFVRNTKLGLGTPLAAAWAQLLRGELLHGLVLSMLLVALNAPLRGTPFDLNDPGRNAYSPSELVRIAFVRVGNEFSGGPMRALAALVPLGRNIVHPWPEPDSDPNAEAADAYALTGLPVVGKAPPHALEATAVRVTAVFLCLLAIVVSSPFLRLAPVLTVLNTAAQRLPRRILLRGAPILVASEISLRLLMAGFLGLFVILPYVVLDSVVVSAHVTRWLSSVGLQPIGAFGYLAIWAICHAAWAPFQMACDIGYLSRVCDPGTRRVRDSVERVPELRAGSLGA
jgi:hypothetical protein